MKRMLSALTVMLAIAACREPIEPSVTAPPLLSHVAPGVWTTASPMTQPRAHFGAATGTDGKVYVFGGSISGFTNNIASGEVYDPATNTWSSITPLAQARSVFASARGGDGRIYAIGGFGASGVGTTSVEAYDPSTDAWIPRAPHPGVARWGLAAAGATNGRIYIAGGFRVASPGGLEPTAAEYDPATDTWSPIADPPAALLGPMMAGGPDGRVYLAGGIDSASVRHSDKVFAYDPATDTWDTLASLPAVWAVGGATFGADGHLYVVGGQRRLSPSTPPFLIADAAGYDVAADAWTPVPFLGVARVGLRAVTAGDGRIYAIGGGAATGVSSLVEVYGPAPNVAPTAAAGADQTAGCAGGGADVTLDGSASSDPDGAIATYEWFEGSTVLATGAAPTVHLGLGAHTLTLRVTDDDGASATDDLAVTVQDTQAPVIGFRVFDHLLWPPDGQLHLVAKVHAADGCDADAALTVTVSSNQPPAEHGRHDPDWRVVERDGAFWVWARAERDGRKKGDRVYTITATATDGSGNVATAIETVTVSHDRRDGHREHDDDDDHGDDGRRHD